MLRFSENAALIRKMWIQKPAHPIVDPDTSIHDPSAVEQICRRCGITPHHLKILRNAYYKKSATPDEALTILPTAQQTEFQAQITFPTLRRLDRHDSSDGATRLLLNDADGTPIESVILRNASGRTSLCISSQSGCANGCVFCASGQLPAPRNLSVDALLGQIITANQLLVPEQRRVRNVVVMGMGEPLQNEDNLYRALDVMCSTACFNLAPRQVTVSTCGLPDAMVRFAARFPQIRMALSLHSVRPTVREWLMPVTKIHPLDRVKDALQAVTDIQKQSVMIEYLLLKDLTDTAEDLAGLMDYLRDIPVRINLLPFNTVAHAPTLTGSAAETRTAFAHALRTAGFTVNMRYSHGADINAACGQLANQQRSGEGGQQFSVRAPRQDSNWLLPATVWTK